MNSTHQFRCPLCNTIAVQTPIGFDKVHVICDNCTEYILAVNVESKLRQSSDQTRIGLASQAKATTNPDYIYAILGRSSTELPHIDLHGVTMQRSAAFER